MVQASYNGLYRGHIVLLSSSFKGFIEGALTTTQVR